MFARPILFDLVDFFFVFKKLIHGAPSVALKAEATDQPVSLTRLNCSGVFLLFLSVDRKLVSVRHLVQQYFKHKTSTYGPENLANWTPCHQFGVTV